MTHPTCFWNALVVQSLLAHHLRSVGGNDQAHAVAKVEHL
jgi:hypothetical protein